MGISRCYYPSKNDSGLQLYSIHISFRKYNFLKTRLLFDRLFLILPVSLNRRTMNELEKVMETLAGGSLRRQLIVLSNLYFCYGTKISSFIAAHEKCLTFLRKPQFVCTHKLEELVEKFANGHFLDSYSFSQHILLKTFLSSIANQGIFQRCKENSHLLIHIN